MARSKNERNTDNSSSMDPLLNFKFVVSWGPGSGNRVALESMTLQNEGWERDDSFEAPKPPSHVDSGAPVGS